MACNASNNCDACFNWSIGTIGPRLLKTTSITGDCKTYINDNLIADYVSGGKKLPVTDCKFYNGLAKVTDTTITSQHCYLCWKTFLNFDEIRNTLACSDTPFEIICGEIKNCMTTVCFKNNSNQVSSGCRMCNIGYIGTGWDLINNTGSTKCENTTNGVI